MMADLSLHILDIAENAIGAGATTIIISINENENRDFLTIRVTDNGKGMTRAVQRKALDPFFTTKGKRTGLGLPLLAQAAEQSGGRLDVVTTPGRGTKVTARFRHSHIDRPPLSKMTETLMMLIIGHPQIDFRYRHRRNGEDVLFASRHFLKETGAPSLTEPVLIREVKKALRGGLEKIGRT